MGCKIGVLASGRGSNFKAILSAQEAGCLGGEVVGLITDNPKAGAIDMAKQAKVATQIIERDHYSNRAAHEVAMIDQLRQWQVDWIVLAGYMRLVGPDFLKAFPDKIINIHPSLLPAFKGLNAQAQALEYGVKIAGCTVHFVDDTVDGGAIIAQAAVSVRPDDSVSSLSDRILAEEHQLYSKVIQLLCQGKLKRVGRQVVISLDGGEE